MYWLIAVLGAYVATEDPMDARKWAGVLLAGFLAIKAKTSNGHPTNDSEPGKPGQE